MIESVVINTMRALMNVLHPLTGDTRAIRTLTITAQSGMELLVRGGAWVFPIIGGGAGGPRGQAPNILFKTQINPLREDGAWQITDTGNSVPIISNLAGLRHNVPVGTAFTFDFQDADIASMVVATIDQEATAPPADGFIKEMSIYEQADPDFFRDLARSEMGRFPAVIVSFDSLLPGDGSTVDALRRGAKVGSNKSLYRIDMQLTIFSSRNENSNIRRVEGLAIADSMIRYLTDRRQTDDGDCLSSPGGLQILNLFRDVENQSAYQKYYIYTMLVTAVVTLERTDTRLFNPWLTTVLNVNKPQTPNLPNEGTLPLVENMIIDMPPLLPNVILETALVGWWQIDDRVDGLSPDIMTLNNMVVGAFDITNPVDTEQPHFTRISTKEFGLLQFSATQHWHGAGAALWPAATSELTMWFTARFDTFTGVHSLMTASDSAQTSEAIMLVSDNGNLSFRADVGGLITLDFVYIDPNPHLFRIRVGGGTMDLAIDGVVVASTAAVGTLTQAGEALNIGSSLDETTGLDGVFHEAVVMLGNPTDIQDSRMTTYMMNGAGL